MMAPLWLSHDIVVKALQSLRSHPWLSLGIVINALLFVPGAYMAASAINIAREQEFSSESVTIAAVFFALPVFCIAVSFAAWRSAARRQSSAHLALLLLSPLAYAVFLTVLLVNY
ncbi:MAG TPA: hypothetical protein VEU06_00010 [Micropepsaceae bacterium]|nr:hypothetical protein [Micropepsaceae bacterium]